MAKHKVFISHYHADDTAVNEFVNKFANEEKIFTAKIVGDDYDTTINSDDPEYIMRKIREDYLTDSTVINDINRNYEKIDCLINCAGMWISGDISKLDQPIYDEMKELGRIKKVIDTNVFGTVAMTKSIFSIMKKQGYGQIININSQSGVMCEPPFPIYNASKTGANAFRKAIQNDLAHNNIKITDVCPGLIQTDFYKRAKNELPENVMNTGLTPKDVANTVKFVFDLPHEITIPSIEVRNIKNY